MKAKRILASILLTLIIVTPVTIIISAKVQNYIDEQLVDYRSQIAILGDEKFALEEENKILQENLDTYVAIVEENRENYNNNLMNLRESLDELQIQNNELLECLETDGLHIRMYNLTEEDLDLLCRCAQAEAGYENYQSQIYVVNTILNRVESQYFPNTIKEVIYDHDGDYYQFTVAKNGMINTEAREDTVNNIKDAFLFNKFDLPLKMLYFHATGTESNCTPYIECEGTTFGYGKYY